MTITVTEKLAPNLDTVISTVPAPVVGKNVLSRLPHHALLVDPRVPLVGPHLHVEALADALQRRDELHHVRRVHVVVRGAEVEHEPPAQVVDV